MIQNTIIKKGLIVGIVLLFLTIGFSPIINADGNTIPQAINDVPITILECKADGTVETTVMRMSSEQADSLHEEMANAHDLDTKLSIYKKYNLISQDITVDSLREGMEERAQEMGATQDDLISQFRSNRSLLPPFVRRNIFCSISGYTFGGGVPLLIPFFRLSPLWDRATHFDIVDFIIGGLSISSKGLFGIFNLECLFVKLVGFVGVVYYFWRNHYGFELDGFCIYTKALGIPDLVLEEY